MPSIRSIESESAHQALKKAGLLVISVRVDPNHQNATVIAEGGFEILVGYVVGVVVGDELRVVVLQLNILGLEMP